MVNFDFCVKIDYFGQKLKLLGQNLQIWPKIVQIKLRKSKWQFLTDLDAKIQ